MYMRLKTRNQLKMHLRGKGVEIGALQNPLDISGLLVDEVKYVDDCETLNSIQNESLDFIIANHLFEHLSDPIGSLKRSHTKLANDGVIFLAVPDNNKTFDIERELTSLGHLVIDSKLDVETRKVLDRGHFYQWAIFVQKKKGKDSAQSAEQLIKEEYSIHYHTYTFESFKKIIKYINRGNEIAYKLKEYSQVFKDGNEFIFILQKR